MSSFYQVSSGAITAAADVNQYYSALSGVTGVQAILLAPSNAITPLVTELPSAPSSADHTVVDGQVSSDAYARVSLYLRSADGYGGVRAGAGVGAPTAHLYAQASGWRTDESFTIGGALNVAGTTTLASLNAGAVNASSLASSGNVQANGAFTGGPFYGSAVSVGGQVAGGSLYFDNGNITSNGGGVLTVVQLQGPVACDVENAQTVFRTGVGALNIVIQVNGHNWVFRSDGKLITPSGATIS